MVCVHKLVCYKTFSPVYLGCQYVLLDKRYIEGCRAEPVGKDDLVADVSFETVDCWNYYVRLQIFVNNGMNLL